jgi:hypothetical protein
VAASYPRALKVFSVFHDYTDVIWAVSINECHDEILALEKTLGLSPFKGTPYTTFGGAIQDLYVNKAPTNHTHTHKNLLNDNLGNDHPQYIMVSGYPGFSHPVGGKAGSNANDLVPLSQLRGLGYQNSAQVQAAVQAALGNLMAGARGGPALWPPGLNEAPNWTIQGGIFSGCTDGSGRVTMSWPTPSAFVHCVQAFTCTKIPPQPPAGGFPCTPYNWIEAQVTLLSASNANVTVQFSHDYSWQPNMWVTFSWIAIGN